MSALDRAVARYGKDKKYVVTFGASGMIVEVYQWGKDGKRLAEYWGESRENHY